MRSKLILPMCLCLALSACAVVEHDPTPTPPPSLPTAQPTPEPALRPSPEWGEQVYMTAFAPEGRLDEPVFIPDYRLPLIQNAQGIPSYEAINAYYAAALDDLAVSAAEVGGWAIDDYLTTQATGDPFFDYVDTETYELTMESQTRVSVLRSHYSNSGGPYPVLYPLSDTFDLTTGARLGFADLFSCSAQEAKERVLDAVLSLNAQGTYSKTVLDETMLKNAFSEENFYLTEDAFTVYFPNADLPQAIGTPTFAVPYTDLEDILLSWE